MLQLNIRAVTGDYGIARLSPQAAIPDWADGQGFVSIARADDELTIVCLQERIPADVEAERDWCCYRTVGPFPFEAAGIVQALIFPLSKNGVGVFVVCTFDGEHVLVKSKERELAEAYFRAAGHMILPAGLLPSGEVSLPKRGF